MQGEFRGDFTRDTYIPSKQFLRVFMQQGRVQVDADWNEQVSILIHYLQNLATDLIGPYGGPKNNCGFKIIPIPSDLTESIDDFIQDNLNQIDESEKKRLKEQFSNLSNEEKPNFLISSGHYYVHGNLCQNQKWTFYSKQENYPFSNSDILEKGNIYLAYLDVWERHINFIEDESEITPNMREVALGKADTTTRSKLVWQVKVISISINAEEIQSLIDNLKKDPKELKNRLTEQKRVKPGTGKLKAAALKTTGTKPVEPCIISPDARYRGAENQLYRVEIHKPGEAGQATFKWSRENGSVVFPVRQGNDTTGTTLSLDHLGWDDRSSLSVGDWVELVDDTYTLQGQAEALRQVDSIDQMNMEVTLKD
ncbi:MAG: DUF6519 domain-containing protein, partial [Bacteroidota bacterium]